MYKYKLNKYNNNYINKNIILALLYCIKNNINNTVY